MWHYLCEMSQLHSGPGVRFEKNECVCVNEKEGDNDTYKMSELWYYQQESEFFGIVFCKTN